MIACQQSDTHSRMPDVPGGGAMLRPHRRRSGVTMVEFVVSAMLLMTVMTFVTTLSFSIGLVWKDIGHHRVATNELTNQLEVLTRVPRGDVQQALDSLAPSPQCRRTLKEAKISGELIADSLGTRVVLQIDWKRRNPGEPIQLVGWVHQPESFELENVQ